MFSGFITHTGIVVQFDKNVLVIELPKFCSDLQIGAQISIAGVRATVDSINANRFSVHLSGETCQRSTLGDLKHGQQVNLEKPIIIGERLEGHLVQGHVDAIGKIHKVDQEAQGLKIWIKAHQRVFDSIIAKGSIAIDGVSLTIAEIVRDQFSVALIPSTLTRTSLSSLQKNHRVNIETDLLAKLAATHRQPTKAIARCIAPQAWSGVVTGAAGVNKAIQQIQAGGAILVWDPDREAEGDIVIAGAHIKPEHFTHILTQACCHPTVPCDESVLSRLEIPPMPGKGDHHGTWMYTSVDLSSEKGTGVSAAQRAATVRQLANPNSKPEDFVMPGHVFPLRARAGGLTERAGHTESVVALCKAAKLPPVGVCCEVMNPDGTMAGPAELEIRALEWGIPLVDVRDLVCYL